MTSPALLKKAFQQAKKAQSKAYAPYSRCFVGAALVTSKKKIFSGCNVENASFGATICAERSAICQMVASGEKKITDCVVVTDRKTPWSPCGICRQVLVEFGYDAMIHMANLKGIVKSAPLKELLPNAFSRDHLN